MKCERCPTELKDHEEMLYLDGDRVCKDCNKKEVDLE